MCMKFFRELEVPILLGQPVRLDEAAILVAAVKTAKTREQEQLLYDFLLLNKDHIEEFCSLLYGPSILKPEHVMSAIHRSYGVFPEEFELVEGVPLVPSLASESPSECEEQLTIPEALSLVSSVRERGVDIATVMNRMDRMSAELIWARALGDGPALSRKRLLRAVAHGGGTYSPERLTQALAVEDMATVLRRAINEELSSEFRIQPGHPFKGPSFARWKYWSVPFENTYYEIVDGARYYAHQVDERVFVYNTSGHMVKDLPIDTLVAGEDCIALVDGHGHIKEWLHTSDDPNLWEKTYEERAVAPKRVRDEAHLRALAESLEDGEVIRLLDGKRGHIHNGHKGGFILPRRVFELPLLITQGKTKSDGEWAMLRLEAMDGFDPIHVGYANIQKEKIPNHTVLQDGCSKPVWSDMNPPIVGSFHALRCTQGKVEGAYLVSIATDCGLSDVMQYGDLWTIDGHGQAR